MQDQTPRTVSESSLSPETKSIVAAPDRSTRQDRLAIWIVGTAVLILSCGSAALFLFFLANLPSVIAQVNAPVPSATTSAAEAQAQALQTATAEVAQETATAASGWPVSIFDAFKNNANDWFVGDVNNGYWGGKVSVADGAYRWEGNSKQGFYWTEFPRMNSVSDFSLTADAQHVGGSSEDSYGLVFRRTGQELYFFSVDDYQILNLWLKHNGEWKTVIHPTRSAAIKPGQLNRLSVVGEGSHFTLFINELYVGEADDSTLSVGVAGVAIDIPKVGDPFDFKFENFELRSTAEYATETVQAERTPSAQGATQTALAGEAQETATAVAVDAHETATTQLIHATSTALALKMATEQAAEAVATHRAEPTMTVQAAQTSAAYSREQTAIAQPVMATATSRAQWPAVVSGSFDNNRDLWRVGSDTSQFGTLTQSILNDKYDWNIETVKSVVWWQPANTRPLSSLNLVVEGRRLDGPNNVRYGLVLRMDSGASNYYYAAIDDARNFTFSLHDNGSWNTLVDESDVSAIRPGAANQVSVSAVGSHFMFFVNDEYVGAADNGTLTTGQAGVAVDVSAVEKATVEFSNFELRAPP